MSIVNTLSLESNRQIKINFAGGDLYSDAGLLLIKEFTCKIGMYKTTLNQFYVLMRRFRKVVYAIKRPQLLLLDLDLTLLDTYGHQEGESFTSIFKATITNR